MDVPSDLRQALAVAPVNTRPGLYRATLDGAWSFLLPSGGVLMSVALAAMRQALGRPELVPASATATFCSAVAEGPLEVEILVLRVGRTAAQLRAHVRSLSNEAAPGDVGLEVTATFVQPRDLVEAPSMTWLPYPDDLPEADTCPAYDEVGATSGMPFYRNLVVRRAFGDVWWSKTWGPETPRVARYYDYRIPPFMADGWLDPLALPPIADTMAAAVHQGVGSKRPPLLFPSLDLTVHFVAPLSLTQAPVLVDTHGGAVFAGTATASAHLWQDRRLVMVATQTMTLRTLKAGT